MNLISEDYLMHHGVKGMKWGVRHDPERTERKAKYKEQRKKIHAEHKKVYSDYLKTSQKMHRTLKIQRKGAKQAYKAGRIDKEFYKKYKKANRNLEYRSQESLEYNMAIAQYKLRKAERVNKALYLKDVYGAESKKYKKGQKLANRNWEQWQNYTVSKTQNGYRVTRTDVYYV